MAARPKVLCVDDDASILRVLERCLGAEFEVLAHTSPVAALEVLHQFRDIVAVLSDLNMPEMTGLELLEHARTLIPSAHRILITASPVASQHGNFQVVAKPFSLPAIREAVRAAVKSSADG